jgi:hypothetical protein
MSGVCCLWLMEVNVLFFVCVETKVLNVNYVDFRLKSVENILQNTTGI